MHQNVFIIGAAGKVGSTLVRQIFEAGDTSSRLHANPTKIVGLAASSTVLFSNKGIGQKDAFSFPKTKKGLPYRDLNELLAIARKNFDELIFVDVTASREPMIAFHKNVMRKTSFSIVTANKNPIAYSDYKTFTLLTREPRRYGYRCSVMAGGDAVPFLRDLRDVRDKPTRIEGCFSGTLGYICSQLEKNVPFSAVLARAHTLGYTEPDPRDDLSGFDVARKLVVLARSAGLPVDLKDIRVQPFIPKRFFKKESADAFMRSAKEFDRYFATHVRNAKKKGQALRYIASMRMKGKGLALRVGLQHVQATSELGALHGTANKIVVVSKIYGEDTPYSVQGPGAGLEVTAQNIRRDLLYLIARRILVR